MSHYPNLIDPAEFGIIADYLRNPRVRINYLLHVPSRDRLAPLAEAIDREPLDVNRLPWLLPKVVERGLRDGSIRISARHSLDDSHPKQLVEERAIPRGALCHAIYAPPYYLVHTPGLFEGTLIRPKNEAIPKQELHQKRGPRAKV